jgi:hypothetical protein
MDGRRTLASAPRPRGGHPAASARSAWGSSACAAVPFARGEHVTAGKKEGQGKGWWLTAGARVAERQGGVGRWWMGWLGVLGRKAWWAGWVCGERRDWGAVENLVK